MATLTNNAWRGINQKQIDDTRNRDARNGTCYDANRNSPGCNGRAPSPKNRFNGQIPDGTADKANQMVMEIIKAEYFRRWDASDRNSADQWYLDQVRRIAERYASGHQGPGIGEAMIGSIPAATRQRAESASFAVLEPEIRRREQAQGQVSAVAWARELGTAVGAGVKNLAPEYVQRAQAEGRASADQWYVDQARRLAQLQVAHDQAPPSGTYGSVLNTIVLIASSAYL